MPVTRAPRCAIASARMPPPQPTSSTFFPLRPRCASIHPRRSGLISCSGLNSPCGSHQRCASELNLASSAGSAFMQRFSQIKSPAGAGLAGAGEGLRLPRADDLELDAADLAREVVELLFAFRLDDGLVEIEPDGGGKGDLFGGRLRLRRGRRRRGLDLGRGGRGWRGRGSGLRGFLRRASGCKRERHEEQPTVLDHSPSGSENLFVSGVCALLVLLERILP